jgi:hypothetical protein
MANIIERFVIHFFCSCGIVLIVYFLISFIDRKYKITWIPDDLQPRLLLSAVLVFAFSTLREAYDVSHGQLLAKAFTDYLSWLLGVGVSVFGLYRFRS